MEKKNLLFYSMELEFHPLRICSKSFFFKSGFTFTPAHRKPLIANLIHELFVILGDGRHDIYRNWFLY